MEEIYKNLSLENIEGEEWRDVVGYEGIYQVSNMGRVKSLANDKTRKEKILIQRKNNNGYLQLMLCKYGKIKHYYVHRLVGNAFLENPNNYPYYNHKNEIKTDNRAVNLEPCTHKYNLNYKTAQARRVAHTDFKAIVEKRKIDYKAIAEKLSRQVYQYDKDGTLVAIWESTNECGRNGYNQGNVTECCNGNRKSHKNYIWSYTPIDSK